MIETEAGVPIAQVRFERQDEGWQVNYAVAPLFRGRGLGRLVLEMSLRRLRKETDGGSVFGRVKDNNRSSRKIFEALGFRALSKQTAGTIVYQREIDGVGPTEARRTGSCR